MHTNPRARIERVVGPSLAEMRSLSGGMIGQVYLLRLEDGSRLVAKVDEGPSPQLEIEGYMLYYLASYSQLPVPELLHCSDRLLVISYLPGESHFTPAAEAHAAELLAALHEVFTDAFGLERDTLIGALPQPNPRSKSWIDFYREHRLLHLGRMAVERGRMPLAMLHRLEKLSSRLDKWLFEPEQPSLLHGDVWRSNVLAQGDRITGFLDPAIYYGHHEMELAYITLFHTYGQPFFERYQEIRPLEPGFWEVRQYIYQLYPLLSHVVHFGGAYVASLEQTMARFGV